MWSLLCPVPKPGQDRGGDPVHRWSSELGHILDLDRPSLEIAEEGCPAGISLVQVQSTVVKINDPQSEDGAVPVVTEGMADIILPTPLPSSRIVQSINPKLCHYQPVENAINGPNKTNLKVLRRTRCTGHLTPH